MKKNIVLLLGLIFLCGCAKLQHIDELLILKDYSDEQDRLHKQVAKQDKRFELLVESVKNQKLKTSNKRAIIKKFGEPNYVENVKKDHQDCERFVYRYSTRYFDSDKIYLYFDPKGQLITTEYIPASIDENSQ